MKQIINVHDRYFRAAMSQPEVARDFFDAYLPQEIKKRVDLQTLQLCKESFIDEKLQLQITDLLFSINFRDQQGYLYLLTEHQSSADKLMPFRICKYIFSIMDQHLKKSKEKILPVVYPLIYYNGKIKYSHSTDLFTLFGAYNDLAKQVLLQPIRLIDLTAVTDEELKQHIWSGIMGLSMKRNLMQNTTFFKTIISLLHNIEKNNVEDYINVTLAYLAQIIDVSNRETFLESMRESLSCNLGEKAMTIAESWIEEGIQKGIQKGIEKGIQQGIEKGVQQGIKKGIQQGIHEGRKDTKKSIALKLLKMGLSIDFISQATELTCEEIEALETV